MPTATVKTVKTLVAVDSDTGSKGLFFQSPEWERIQWEAHIRVQGEIGDLENSFRAAGCPDICTLDQAARALTATKQHPTDAASKTWIKEQIRWGYLPALNRGRWPWSPKTIRLQDLAGRVVNDDYDH